MKRIMLYALCSMLCFAPAQSTELFDPAQPVQDGLDVFEVSAVFSDIYEQLDNVKWAGRDIRVALESLEAVHPEAHVALTDNRAVLVWRGDVVGNWPRPRDGDFRAFGQITTAMILRLRESIPAMRRMSDGALFELVVGALVRGIDEDGRYILSKREEIMNDGRLLTSAGIEGIIDERGNFRVTGVFTGSPASAQNIKSGDLIVGINGREIADMKEGEVAAAFAGFNSGTIRIQVLNESGSRNVTLRRATVVITDADVIWKDPILEIVINKVSDNSAQIVNEALRKYQAGGIILDLRTAQGDDERAAARLAGLFLGRVPVLRSVETARSELEITAGGDAITNAPAVVIVAGGTSGTAEAIAAAFLEHNRGVLIGLPTSGRARLATKIDLKNGGALEIHNRKIKTAQGRDLDGRGIFPLVCLSNIRNNEQQNAFFINVINGQFGARDFNREDVSRDAILRGCPAIRSGADEDAVSQAVAVKILTDEKVYKQLLDNR